MKIVSARLEGELEIYFNKQLAVTHKKVSDLLRQMLEQHRAINENPIAYLSNQPSFQKLLGLAIKTDLEVKAEMAKQDTIRMQAEQKKQAAKDRALTREAHRVDWGDSEGQIVTGDGAEQIADGFQLGDR